MAAKSGHIDFMSATGSAITFISILQVSRRGRVVSTSDPYAGGLPIESGIPPLQ